MSTARRLLFASALVFCAACLPGPAVLAEEAGGRLVVTVGDRHEVAVLTPGGEALATVPVGIEPRGMAVRGQELFVANRGTGKAPGSSLTVIDLETFTPLRTVHACEGCAPYSLVFDHEGRLWYTGQGDRALFVMEPPYEHAAGSIILAWGWPTEVAAVEGSDRLLVALRASNDFAVVNTITRTFERVAFGPVPSQVFSRPGAAEGWVAAEQMGFLGVVGPGPDEGPAEFESFKIADTITDACFLPDGQRIALAASQPKIVGLIDAGTRTPVGRLDFQTPPGALAVSPDGQRIAAFLPEAKEIVIVTVAGDGSLSAESRFEFSGQVKSILWLP